MKPTTASGVSRVLSGLQLREPARVQQRSNRLGKSMVFIHARPQDIPGIKALLQGRDYLVRQMSPLDLAVDGRMSAAESADYWTPKSVVPNRLPQR